MAFKGLCLFLVLCLVAPKLSAVAQQTSEQRLTTTLSPRAKDAADLLHVTDWVQRLLALQAKPQAGPTSDRRAIMMKMIIYKRVMGAFLSYAKLRRELIKN